jgi:hypothetical protein
MRPIAVQFNSLILPQRDDSFVKVLASLAKADARGCPCPVRLPLRSQLAKEILF